MLHHHQHLMLESAHLRSRYKVLYLYQMQEKNKNRVILINRTEKIRKKFLVLKNYVIYTKVDHKMSHIPMYLSSDRQQQKEKEEYLTEIERMT